MLRVAARDLGGASLDEVVAEISTIADACIAEALELAPGGDTLAVIGLGKLGGVRTQLRERRRPAVPASGGRTGRAGSRRTRGGRRHRVARRAHRRGHRAARGRRAAARRAIRCAESFARRDPRLLRAGLGHLGTPGHDQGAARRGPCRPGQGLRAGDRAVRLSAASSRPRDRRRSAHQGSPGGIHPAAGQGVHRGQARPRRHPRRGVRGAAAADRARPAGPRAAAHPTRSRALRALAQRGLRRRRRR